ncbi:MAG: ATP-binding cassette domain-containing protein [Gammaproteobacteria bacterium]
MISLRNLSLQRGGRFLFESVNLTVYPAQKIGVTGPNGTGKSSLFALLRAELHQDSGDFDIPARWVIGHVGQETPALEISAIDYVMDGDSELRDTERELEDAHLTDDGIRIAALHAHYDSIDGYTARVRAAQLLHGLGFSAEEHNHAVNTFSGGWRMLLNLARALMCRSDLLLLDEPTNHLDLDAVLWLEQWLRGYGGTLLLISHDRDFLDNVVGYIANVEHQQITLYKGNYAQYERQRAEKLALQQAAFEKQQLEIAHIQDFVRRFRAKASKARQAQSRLKALDRMETIAAAHVDSPLHFEFKPPEKSPNPLLYLDEAVAGYGEHVVLRDIKLQLVPGSRLGLLGRNGAGKSTLIKLLAGLLKPLHGERQEGTGLKIGYFAQHQLEQLRPDDSALLHLQRLDRRAREQELRNFLGGFGFTGEDAMRPVEPFSGGEKARLALALLVWQRPNLLLLDEPTNHLDLAMRDTLTMALQDYEGALVVVSHDRHLLRTTTDSLVLVADGRVTDFDGDLDDYRDWLSKSRSGQNAKNESPVLASKSEKLPTASRSAADRKQQKRIEAEQRSRNAEQRRPLERRLAEFEKKIEKLTAETRAIEATLADPAIYEPANKDQLKAAVMRQAQLAESLRETEKIWLEASETLEES